MAPKHDVPAPVPDTQGVSALRMLAIGLSALVIFAAACAVTYALMRHWAPDLPIPPPPQVYQAKIGIPDQRAFAVTPRGEVERQRDLDRLETYGWVDPDGGVIHVPIESAIDSLVKEQGGAR